MMKALRRFLIRRQIRRWQEMYHRYLFDLRVDAEMRAAAWEDYKPQTKPPK